MNVPLIILSLIICFARLIESKTDEEGAKIDWLVLCLLIIPMPIFIYATINGSEWGWLSLKTVLSYAVAISAMIALYFVENKSKSPIIQFKLFANHKWDAIKMNFKSPWLEFERPDWPSLKETAITEGDVAIIGAGISGVATLYFLLTQTNKRVILLEKDQVASGATGNNAGMVAAHIEKPISELIDEFGIDKTKQAFSEIDRGWNLLEALLNKIEDTDNFISINEMALGFATVENLVNSIKQEKIQASLSRSKWNYWAVDNKLIKQEIPAEYIPYIRFVPQQKILSALRTISTNYVAAAVPSDNFRTARINSAKLCYKILSYLRKEFPDRFSVYENTNISKIEIIKSHAILQHSSGTIKTGAVILCTNGFKDFLITDQTENLAITKLKKAITAREGYLSAYIDENNPSEKYSAGFFDEENRYENVPYFYVSYAPIPCQLDSNLFLVGGPEYDLPHPCLEKLIEGHAISSFEMNKKFIKNEINPSVDSIDYFWRGIMGYTNNGLRWVGQDPTHPRIWYNLGCNGIGILHAISGAEKIAAIMQGKTYPPSLFDPPI